MPSTPPAGSGTVRSASATQADPARLPHVPAQPELVDQRPHRAAAHREALRAGVDADPAELAGGDAAAEPVVRLEQHDLGTREGESAGRDEPGDASPPITTARISCACAHSTMRVSTPGIRVGGHAVPQVEHVRRRGPAGGDHRLEVPPRAPATGPRAGRGRCCPAPGSCRPARRMPRRAAGGGRRRSRRRPHRASPAAAARCRCRSARSGTALPTARERCGGGGRARSPVVRLGQAAGPRVEQLHGRRAGPDLRGEEGARDPGEVGGEGPPGLRIRMHAASGRAAGPWRARPRPGRRRA